MATLATVQPPPPEDPTSDPIPAKTSNDLRDVNVKETARRFKSVFHGPPLSRTLIALIDSAELKARQ